MNYIAVKEVSAVPMTAEGAILHGYRVNNITEGDGYEVTYPEGYKSWCPKDIFEKYNVPVEENSLASTCKEMISPDYKQRFLAEYKQLFYRIHKLAAMLDKWNRDELEFTPKCSKELLTNQLEVQSALLQVLQERAVIEGIELS